MGEEGRKMKVGILSARTGNGHISVANALKGSFEKRSIHVEVFESFYEDLMISNKIISDYYNFLMMTSTPLCYKFSELSYMTRPDLSEDFYAGVEKKIKDFIIDNQFDVIISTSHTINFAVILALEELGLRDKIKFYIVVTDPYVPISVGFDVKGADRYFCTGSSVKKYLTKNIDEEYIYENAYPINEVFLKEYTEDEVSEIYKELELSRDKKILLINSGSQGAFHCKEYLKEAVKKFNDLQIIFICGKNEPLYNIAKMIIGENERVKILGYVNNMNDILRISDVVLTKPGANSFYECIYMRKPMLLDKMEGFLYQEKGAADFIKEHEIGVIADSLHKFTEGINDILERYDTYISNLQEIEKINGADVIVDQIINV